MHPQLSAGIVLLCGRSFSGKTTVAAALAQHLPAVVVSFDMINAERGLYGGEGVSVEEWARTYRIAQARTRDAVGSGKIVVVDDTSSPRFLRDGWRQMAGEAAVPLVLVYVDTPLAVSASRHAANRADQSRSDVTDQVMQDHLSSFDAPAADEEPISYSSSNGDLDNAIRRIRRRLQV
jgi:predicted kinase